MATILETLMEKTKNGTLGWREVERSTMYGNGIVSAMVDNTTVSVGNFYRGDDPWIKITSPGGVDVPIVAAIPDIKELCVAIKDRIMSNFRFSLEQP